MVKGLTYTSSWRHVPGPMNPAGLPSRECSISKLVQSRWWKGFQGLLETRNHWPKEEFMIDESIVGLEANKTSRISSAEPKKSKCLENNATLVAIVSLKLNKFTSWYLKGIFQFEKAICVMAWILKLKKK